MRPQRYKKAGANWVILDRQKASTGMIVGAKLSFISGFQKFLSHQSAFTQH
jgi:hypothetical protein